MSSATYASVALSRGRRYCYWCLIFLLWSPSIATGNYGESFLRLGVGARALGFGGTFISLADDGTAVYWNPAGLGQIQKPQVTLNHAYLFKTLAEHDFVNAAIPLNSKTVIGMTWVRLDVDNIPGFSARFGNRLGSLPLPGGLLKDNEQAYIFTLARIHRYHPTLGQYTGYLPIEMPYAVNVKFIRQTIGGETSTGFGIDLGYMLKLGLIDAMGTSHGGHFTMGITAKDIIGTRIYWDTRPDETIKPSFRLGFSYTQPIKPLNSTVIIAEQHNIYNGDSFRIGLEFWYENALAIRIGEAEEFTVGGGIILWRMMFDYAFLNQGNGGTHHISTSLNF